MNPNKCKWFDVSFFILMKLCYPFHHVITFSPSIISPGFFLVFESNRTSCGCATPFICSSLVVNLNYFCSLYEVGNVGRCLNSGSRCTPEHVWREGTKYEARDNSLFGSIWSSAEASTNLSSSISCIRRIGMHCSDPADDASSFQRALYPWLFSDVFMSLKILF